MDPLRLYLKDIKKIPLLTPEDELKLARKAKRGDTKARSIMIRSNLRLVINIAKRYSYLGVPMSDLIEEGNLGLMKAVSKFNHRKGYRFSTYAAWWIRQHITRAIADQGKTIRIPVYMNEAIVKWRKASEALMQKLGRPPTTKEVAKKMRLPIKKVKQISSVIMGTTSLEAPVGEEGEGQIIELVQDESIPSPADELTKLMRHERLSELLEMMTKREKEVLTLRFGLEDGVGRTLEEVASHFKLTRERVRQIENAAIQKLKLLIVSQES